MSKTGGGAFVAVTKQCIIVGSYLKDQDMSVGGKQNIGNVTNNVLNVAKTLSEAGYWGYIYFINQQIQNNIV